MSSMSFLHEAVVLVGILFDFFSISFTLSKSLKGQQKFLPKPSVSPAGPYACPVSFHVLRQSCVCSAWMTAFSSSGCVSHCPARAVTPKTQLCFPGRLTQRGMKIHHTFLLNENRQQDLLYSFVCFMHNTACCSKSCFLWAVFPFSFLQCFTGI